MRNTKNYFLLLFIFSISTLVAQTPAFPGAEGGGMFTTGGRGGKVYYVNSLEDKKEGDKNTQEGTLRWCLDREGPKTILFKVAGVIFLKADLNISSNTTIAGQSAPGDGICLAGNSVKLNGDNIIVRYLRFRLGDLEGVEEDAFTGTRKKNIIIDHCSMSWSTDECASFYDNENFTLQWCILSESLRSSVHKKGNHGYAAIWGGKKASFHHNLLAHHDSRNPRMCGSRFSNEPHLELVDFRNNVIYNWGANSGYAGEGGCYNFINNYYKPTQYSTHPDRIFSPNPDAGDNKQAKGVWGKFYVKGNYVVNNEKVTNNNLLGIHPASTGKKKLNEIISDVPFDVPFVSTHTAKIVYERVLDSAGASFRRDKTDARVVDEVRNGLTPIKTTGKTDTRPGMINSQNDVGGWDEYVFKPQDVPEDSNIDGIPDRWLESKYPGKKASDLNEEGYTYLEVYLNSLLLPQETVTETIKDDNAERKIIVDRNGRGDFRNIKDAIEFIRISEFKEPVTVFIREGFYKEKILLPGTVCNVKFVGENRDKTIINYDDHANVDKMGTFRTYTFKVQGNDISFENLTIENSAEQLGQAVALHVEGDRIIFRNCRFLGNQDTIYAGHEKSRQYFENCYIEGTTDFIFGPSTAWFENCRIHCKKNSYITAASTPEHIPFGYVFNNCTITLAEDVTKVYLGRPWRPFAMTLFMNCELPEGVSAAGWDNWRNPENEKTARYLEYNNKGKGADTFKRVKWTKQLSEKEAKQYTVQNVLKGWMN